MKKNTIHILLLGISTLLMLSCENFRDDNGDLGGSWQLTQWYTRSSSGEIDSLVATNLAGDTTVANPRKLYYCIHRDVLQLRDAADFYNIRYFCTFRSTPDSLILGEVVDTSGKRIEDIINAEEAQRFLMTFGVPADRHFHIDQLTDSRLQLSTPDDLLIFRRY